MFFSFSYQRAFPTPTRDIFLGWRRWVVVSVLLLISNVSVQAATRTHDIVYGEAGGEKLLLDASVPEGEGSHPVAILVHGGGWGWGDKSGSNKPGDGSDISPWFSILDRAGFTWFSINYRLAPRHRWPAALEDVETAIRWVKAHAGEYRGDPRRITLFGHSAGGHLVCFVGVAGHPDTRVQAIVGFAPVTDLLADSQRRGGLSISLQGLSGFPEKMNSQSEAWLQAASPIDHVRGGLAPFLILHGDADRTVPFEQTSAFQKKLQAAGDRCDVMVIPGAPHGLLTWEQHEPDYAGRLIKWLDDALAVPR